MPLVVRSNASANKLVAKIVDIKDDGTPSDTLADPNAIAKVAYKDIKTANWYDVMFEFPAEVRLKQNKQYFFILEWEGALDTSKYVTVRNNNSGKNTLYTYTSA